MIRSYLSGWKNYINTSKRTNRKTFWSFVFIDLLIMIFTALCGIFFSFVDKYPFLQMFELIVGILFFVLVNGNIVAMPARICISARRVKDTGKSTNWMLFLFVPIVGWLILLIIFLQESMTDSQKTLEQTIPIKLISNDSDQNEISNNIASKIEELNSLKEKGIISEEEYEKMRKNTLGL